jgi:hypothetical protein
VLRIGGNYLFSTVDQVPVVLVIPGVGHHIVVQLEVRRLDRKLAAFQVFRGRRDIANAFTFFQNPERSSGGHFAVFGK